MLKRARRIGIRHTKPIYVSVKDLDVNQRSIYDQRLEAKFIVKGCAGSGKTSLALLKMQQLLATRDENGKRPSFYYVSFVRELVECVRREMGSLEGGDRGPNDYMITCQNWQDGYISSYMQHKFHIRAAESRRVYQENSRYPSYKINIDRNPQYLLVDECQDLEREDIDSLANGAREGVCFYGDDAQHIMECGERRPMTLEMIHQRLGLPIYPLINNYRLPKEVALFAEELGGRSDLSRHCQSLYHEKPVVVRVEDESDAIDYMAKRIKNFELSDVGVAFSDNLTVREVTSALEERIGDVSGSWSLTGIENGIKRVEGVDWGYLYDSSVKVMTYEKIKGQQFETVFLYVDGEFDPEMLKRFYVGVTRAERFLYILYRDTMPSALRQIPVSLYKTDDTIRIEPEGTAVGKENPVTESLSDEGLNVIDIGF